MIRALFSSLILTASAGSALAQAPAKPAPAPTPTPTDGGVDGAAASDLAKAADAAADLATLGNGDDLAKAADVTAEVAGTPGATPAAPAAASAAKPGDDVDLAALGLDPTSQAGFDDKLNLYGFMSFAYTADHWSKDYPFFASQNPRSFTLANLNLYIAKNLTPRARTLAEVRFTFLPNGGTAADGTTIDTSTADVTDFSQVVQWGGIVIERAYAEYDLTDHLTVRGGHWLTPYGIWNTDHGAPAIISTSRPYIIGQDLFPQHQTGLDLFGNYAVEGFKLGYHATVSNGRGVAEAQQDHDTHVGLGGRLELETPWGLRIGSSYYRGRFTGGVTTPGGMPETYLEAAYGGDAQYDRGPLHIQGEVIGQDRHYADGARAASPAGFKPDARAFGWYGVAGYRLDLPWYPTPYVFYNDYWPSDKTYYGRVWGYAGGVNLRPSPTLVLKASVNYAKFSEGQGVLVGGSLVEFMTQAAWVF